MLVSTSYVLAVGDGGARVRIEGNSTVASMFTQKGMKGINQDAITVWENFNGEKDLLFCGVFDGHGPEGHTVARHIRDTLPSRLTSAFKLSQLNNGCNPSDLGQHKQKDNYGNRNKTNEMHENSGNLNPVLSTWTSNFFESFKVVDDELVRNPAIDSYCSGTTAVTVIKQEDQLVIANLGDSRAIMCTRGNKNELPGRVHASIDEPDVQRLWLLEHDDMGLAMSRAFGDFCLKRCGLIAVPEVTYRKLTDRDEFVVIASDGVWDVLSNTEVVQIVASASKRSQAAKLLVEKAVKAWRYKYPGSKTDDCAVICLFLKKQLPRSKKNDTALEGASSWTTESRHTCRTTNSVVEPSGNATMNSKEEYTALDGGARVNSIMSIPRFSLSWRKIAKEVELLL